MAALLRLSKQIPDTSRCLARTRTRLVISSDKAISKRRFASGKNDELFDISGQSVVVTGGGQGIGKAIASSFAQRGCSVYVLDLKLDDAERCAAELKQDNPSCPGAWGFACDVRDDEQVRDAARSVSSTGGLRGGAADVLINCAGVTKRMPVEDFPLEEFDRIQATNTRGVWSACMHFGKPMLERGTGGCIINIDSVVTAVKLKHILPYTVSKSGVMAMTQGLALEWGQHGVRVNGLAPGLIVTAISEAMWNQPHMAEWGSQQTPLGRMGRIEDLVGTAVFLASPAASFISGQTLRVDGGLSCGRYWPIEGPSASSASSSRSKPGAQASARAYCTFAGRRGFSTQASTAILEHAPVTEFNYQAGDFVVNPFEGDGVERNKEAGAIGAAKHIARDGRLDSELVDMSGDSLRLRGLSLQRHHSSVQDFYNSTEVKDKYYPELCAEAVRLTGADRVVIASHVVRNSGPSASSDAAVRGGAFMVHGDFCDDLQEQLGRMLADGKPCIAGEAGLGLSQEELKKGRLVVLNFWRPLCTEPLQRAPLSVCDAKSMDVNDMQIYAHDPQPPPQNYVLPLPNRLTVAVTSQKHQWFHFPGMTRDEVVVFKTYDSVGLQPANGVGVHSAFEDPTTAPDAPTRESIEARVLCFFSGAAKEPATHSTSSSVRTTARGFSTQAANDTEAKWQAGAAETAAARPAMENVERLRFYRWLEEIDGWSGAVGLTAKFSVPKEKEAIYLDIMRENIAGTRREEGMLQYDLTPDYDPDATSDDVCVYFLLERFRTRKDLLDHVNSPHYKRCQERFLDDMGGHPLVQICLYRLDPVEP